jgi:hypothetical protein
MVTGTRVGQVAAAVMLLTSLVMLPTNELLGWIPMSSSGAGHIQYGEDSKQTP